MAWCALAAAVLLALAAPAAAQAALPSLVPEQVHVTLGEQGGLVVQWAVLGSPYSTQDRPSVAYSLADGPERHVLAHLSGVVVQSSTTAPAGGPGTAYHYAATLPVPLGSEVTYTVGSPLRGQAGPFAVRNVPDEDSALRFVAYGDIGVDRTAPDGGIQPEVSPSPPSLATDSPAHRIRDLAVAAQPDLWVVPGDLAYDNSGLGWTKFMRFAQPLQATVPTMPSIGNHEWDGENALGYSQFLNAYVLPGDEQDFVYRAGPVTFVVVNSDSFCGEHKAAGGSPQEPCHGQPGPPAKLAWLESALLAAASDATPWTVVYFHHPVWSWGRHGSSETLQATAAPLFERHGVDVVITAHDHLYSRTHPLVAGRVAQDGPTYVQGDGVVYIVVGGGGRDLYAVPSGDAPDWHAAGEAVHHLSVWDATPERISVNVTRADGSLLDAFAIARGAIDTAEPASDAPFPAMAPVAALLAAAVALRRRGTR